MYVCKFCLDQWSLPEYLHNYILRNKIKSVLTLYTSDLGSMHVLTWPHKPSYEEAALAALSPGVTSHQYLQRPPLCGNICPRASGGGPGVSRPRTKPGCQPRICRRSLIPHLHTSLPDFNENFSPRCRHMSTAPLSVLPVACLLNLSLII